MARPFNLLRARLLEHGYETKDVARELERCESYVSSRMMARFPWNMDEMATIMEMIKEPWENVHRIFPIGGKNET